MKQIIFFIMILSLAACSSIPGQQNKTSKKDVFLSLINTDWKLVEINLSGKSVKLDRETMKDEFTLSFSDTIISGKAFPNRYTAGYEIRSGNNVSFKVIAATRMLAVNEPYPVKEDDYLKYLQSTTSWNITKNSLCLPGVLETGNEVLMFFIK